MIKVIAFDLHGVIGKGTTKDIIEIISKKLSISPELAEKGIRNEKRIPAYLGDYSMKEYWEEFIKVVGNKGFTSEELMQEHIDSFVPDSKMFELLVELRKNYKIALITNNIREKFEALNEKFNLESYFDVMITGYQYKLRKPDSRIYKILCEKTSAQPEEIIFIDDLERNILPAREFGLKAIHFKNREQVIEEINKLIL